MLRSEPYRETRVMHPSGQAEPGGCGSITLLRLRSVFLWAALLGTLSSPREAMGQDGPLRAGADVQRPTKTTHVDPLYPELARARHVEKVVVVGFVVDTEGQVTDPIVLSGHALLDQAALSAVRQWRYRPTRVDGQAVCVRMVEKVPFWLGQASRPPGWPSGSSAGSDTWTTWPGGENRPRLELLELDSEELPSPSTLRIYRGTVRNRSKKPLRNVLAVAASRDSLNALPEAAAQEIGDLEPGEERSFELRPQGHQVDIGFGQFIGGAMKPLPTRRQIRSMARVLPSRPIAEGQTHACLCSGKPPDLYGQGGPEGGSQAKGGYDRPPRPIKVTKPEYDKQAFEAAMEGTVVVEIIINRTGHVDCARALTSLPGTGLDAEALRAVHEWRFEPAMKDGSPVAALAHAPVRFRIY